MAADEGDYIILFPLSKADITTIPYVYCKPLKEGFFQIVSETLINVPNQQKTNKKVKSCRNLADYYDKKPMENEKRTRSGSKRYYWMRLKADFFESPEIKKLRKLAGGDTYTIIYLKMMLKTITNDGLLVFQGIEDTLEKEVALIIDEDENNVMMTIAYLRKHNLMEEGQSENAYLLNAVPELIGSETADAQRKRIARSLDSEQIIEIAADGTVTDNVRQLSENVRTLSDRIEQNREEQNREEIDIEQNRVQKAIDSVLTCDPQNSEELAWSVTNKMNSKQYAAFYSLFEQMKNGQLKTTKDDLYRYFNKLYERDWKDSNGKPIRDLVKYVQTNFALNSKTGIREDCHV